MPYGCIIASPCQDGQVEAGLNVIVFQADRNPILIEGSLAFIAA